VRLRDGHDRFLFASAVAALDGTGAITRIEQAYRP
jgi:hypothetical protein